MENGFRNIFGMFNANTELVGKTIADIGPEDWFRSPGDDSNHLIWVVGHLIVHRGAVLKLVGIDWNSSWEALFAPGAKRIDHSGCPPIDEMRAAWNDTSAQLADSLRQVPSETLDKPASDGQLSFDKKLSGVVAFYAFHDTYHSGQVSYLRKWLGYGQTVG